MFRARLLKPFVTLLWVGVLTILSTEVYAARQPGFGIAQPTNHVSPSGAYSLFVDPADRYGRGAATYRFSRNGIEVWSGTKPYALCEVSVTDDGFVAAMAYRQAQRDPNEEKDSEQFLHIVILGSDGREVLNEVKTRHHSSMHGPTLPEMAQFIVDVANDRIIARVQARKPEWWIYRLSTGESIAQADPIEWMSDLTNLQFMVDAQLLSGTPLVLLHWYVKSPDYKVKDAGAAFALVDPIIGSVWSFEAKNDYANIEFHYFHHGGGGPQVYFEKHPAIVSTAPAGRFDLRLFAENRQVAFAARQGSNGTWAVTELGRISIPEDQPAGNTLPTNPVNQLTSLGELKLTSGAAAESPFQGLWDFTFDTAGKIYFIKGHQDKPGVLYGVDTSGKIVSERPFEWGRVDWAHTARMSDGKFLVSRQKKKVDGDGDEMRDSWAELATDKETPLNIGVTGSTEGVGRFSDGSLVVLGSYLNKSSLVEGLARYDTNGNVKWKLENDDPFQEETRLGLGPRDVVVTTEGQVVLLSMSSVRILSGEGELIKKIDLTGAFGNDEFGGRPGYLHEVVADNDGGFLIADPSTPPVVLRYHGDGSLRSRWSPRHADGKTFDLRPKIRVAPDGRLWTGDGKSIMRLTDDGVVDVVLGPKPQADQLDGIVAFTVDRQGNYYAVAPGSGVVHVFDQSGRHTRILAPDPKDVAGTVKESFVAVRDDGEVYVKKPPTKMYMPPDEYLRFSATGERLESITFAPSIPVGRFLSPGWAFQPVTGYRCGICPIGSDTRLVMIKPPDQVIREERRRPNGKYFGNMNNLAMAPNGSMAILNYDILDKESDYEIDVFSAKGDPIRTLRLPAPQKRYSGIACDGQRVVVTESGVVVVVDLTSGSHETWSLSETGDSGMGADPYILPGGDELLLFDKKAQKLNRYQLPKQIGKADSNPLPIVETAPLDPAEALVKSSWVKRFLDMVVALPQPGPCVAYLQKVENGEKAMTETEAMKLTEEERTTMRTMNLDDCGTRFDAPRMYARILDLAAQHGLENIEGKRVLDFGCCDIRHLQVLARLAVDVVWAQTGYTLRVMCNDFKDVGELRGPDGKGGHLEILRGSKLQPDNHAEIKGDGYDLITLRDILQNPDSEDYFASDRWLQTGLGRDQRSVVAALFEFLRPGGYLVVYNLAIKPGEPANVFKRELWTKAGFEVIAFDNDDRSAAYGIGKELGWDVQVAHLDSNIHAMYTIVRRPAGE